MRTKIVNLCTWFAAAFLLVLLDQYTKFLVVAYLKGREPLVIWKGVFELLYSENRGAAFGLMQGRQLFFFLVAVFVLLVAAFAMVRMPSWKNSRYHGMKICAIMITAGAVGNMIDRMRLGYVVDFLYVRLIDFPIFNVADIYVTTATAALLFMICFYYKEEDMECFRWSKKKGEQP